MIQLHYFPSTASMAPHILLEELGVPFELVHVDRMRDAHKRPEYLALNPNGLIPVLVHDDLVLYESAAVCLHLADTHAQPALAPALGTAQRAQFYKWMMWMTNTLQANLLSYFYPERYVTQAHAPAAPGVKDAAEARIGPMLDQLDAQVARSGGPWLLGAQYTAADPYALMLCRWTRNFTRPARERPALGAYLQRVLARPAVQRVFATEQLPTPWV
jgi:glutathione S-transferase